MHLAVVFALFGLLVVPSAWADPAARVEPVKPGEVAKIQFRSYDAKASRVTGYLARPPGAGPFAAIVAMHGCGGVRKANGKGSKKMIDWGRRLRDAGYVVLFVDSFGSRGHGSLCKTMPRPVTQQDRSGDVAGAADWLAGQDFVDPKRIALIGWSNGGTAVLWAAEPKWRPRRADFAAAIAFYPWCRKILKDTLWRPRLPLTILIGSADDWTPAAPCTRISKRWGSRIVVYDGAYHSFDHPHSPRQLRTGTALSARGDGLAISGTDPEARKAAIDEVLKILSARLWDHR